MKRGWNNLNPPGGGDKERRSGAFESRKMVPMENQIFSGRTGKKKLCGRGPPIHGRESETDINTLIKKWDRAPGGSTSFSQLEGLLGVKNNKKKRLQKQEGNPNLG